jgi:lipopolysaccharide transport system ATP-binding protein
VGIYLMTSRGEYVLTSFDTDEPGQYERFSTRKVGRFVSRCEIPPDFLNEGSYVIGVNASAYRIKRYFLDDRALAFAVDGSGAPGTQWPETRLGPVRPRLNWKINTTD